MLRYLKENQNNIFVMSGAINFLRSIEYLEEIFKDAMQDKTKKGWQRTHLSLQSIVKGFIDKFRGNDKPESLETVHFVEAAERIQEEYSERISFPTTEANEILNTDNPSPWEDDSIFKGMTAWEIYQLGVSNSDAANRTTITMCVVGALMERREMTPNVIKGFIGRVDELTEELLSDENKMRQMIKKCRSMGLNIPDRFFNATMDYLKYETKFRNRWKW